MKKILWFIAFIIFCLWIVNFYDFVSYVYNKTNQTAKKSDIIVALTGGANRVDEAFTLLRKDMADTLFISGVYKGTTLKAISSDVIPDKTIILGKAAKNTLENAQEIANYVARNNLKSIILVTSSYHMKRAILDVKTFMPDVVISPYNVYSKAIYPDKWWGWPMTAWLLLYEHTKYNLDLVRHFTYSAFDIDYDKITSLEDQYL